EGTWRFRATVTDNSGGTASAEKVVTVNSPTTRISKNITWRVYYPAWGAAYLPNSVNNFNTSGATNTDLTFPLNYEDNTKSAYTIRLRNFNQLSNNANTGTYGVNPSTGVSSWANGFPLEIGQQTSYFNGTRYITFSG